jgi:hypothetical protein
MDTFHTSSCSSVQTSSLLTKTIVISSYEFNETTACGSSDLTKMWLSNNKLFTVEKEGIVISSIHCFVIFGANKIKLLIVIKFSVIPFKIKCDPPSPLPYGPP